MPFLPKPYRPTPTDRQKVVSERLAETVKDLTGVVVDAETARAVRWTMNKLPGLAIFESAMELEILTAHAKHQRRRAYAMDLLRQADQELSALLNDDHDWEDDDA